MILPVVKAAEAERKVVILCRRFGWPTRTGFIEAVNPDISKAGTFIPDELVYPPQ